MSNDYVPLRIEIRLSNMFISTMPVHLDDLLAASAVKQARIQLCKSELESEDYASIIDNLPIQKHWAGDEWVYKASILNYTSMQGKFMRPYSRRINATEFAVRRDEGVLAVKANNLNLLSGPLKSAIGYMPTASYVVATAYCVGNANRVSALLSNLSNIGKKHSRGQGVVLSINVTETEEDDNSWKKRFLPLSMIDIKQKEHAVVANIGIKPPYWKNDHKIGFGIPNF
jgi:CRISPR type IV-associated protein Csf3